MRWLLSQTNQLDVLKKESNLVYLEVLFLVIQ